MAKSRWKKRRMCQWDSRLEEGERETSGLGSCCGVCQCFSIPTRCSEGVENLSHIMDSGAIGRKGEKEQGTVAVSSRWLTAGVELPGTNSSFSAKQVRLFLLPDKAVELFWGHLPIDNFLHSPFSAAAGIEGCTFSMKIPQSPMHTPVCFSFHTSLNSTLALQSSQQPSSWYLQLIFQTVLSPR